jgi:hypothetical protein
MIDKIYTQSDFARHIGSKQWVSDKIRNHVSKHGHTGTIMFNSVMGDVITVRLVRSSGSLKWLLCIV